MTDSLVDVLAQRLQAKLGQRVVLHRYQVTDYFKKSAPWRYTVVMGDVSWRQVIVRDLNINEAKRYLCTLCDMFSTKLIGRGVLSDEEARVNSDGVGDPMFVAGVDDSDS